MKQVFWRICLFYIVSLLLVGLLVKYTDPRLLSATGSSDAKASPFVIAISNAGLYGLDSVMNVIIMISVLSVGNSSVYGSSRTLVALAEQRQAPACFGYIDRRGRPIIAILFAFTLGLLAFLAASSQENTVFVWMQALSGLSSIFTWMSICLAHIRFRRAWRIQGHTLDELAFRSQAGIVGSWVGFIINALVLAAQFWTGFAPIGYQGLTVSQRVQSFFQAYLAAPIVLAFYLAYKTYYRPPFIRTYSMDLHTGTRDLNLQVLLAEERLEQATWPRWKRAYKVFC